LVTLTETDAASRHTLGAAPRPATNKPTLGLMADPLALRRLEALLMRSFEIVCRAEEVDVLVSAPPEVAVLCGGDELCGRGSAIERLAGLVPAPTVVLVGQTDARWLVRKALQAGARGFVCERTLQAALVPTIQAAMCGQLCVPPTIRGRVAWRSLSLRERQVLQLVARGMTNGEIACRLCLSESTVKTHLSSSFRKLGVSSRAEAAALVLDPDHGLNASIPSRTLIALERQLLAHVGG
jgi:DNA-binding NarL/FixJ family response regulator